MKKSKSEGPEFKIPSSSINFEALVKEHGFLKARQLLHKANIEQHQQDVISAEKERHEALHKQRANETLKLSATSGKASTMSITEKILAANPSIQALERALNGESNASVVGLVQAIKAKELQQQLEKKPHERHEYLKDHKTQYSLQSTKWELLIPNNGLTEFPQGLCENMHLQTSYLRQMNASRNNFVRLANHQHPQISVYHFRYLTLLNLSFNNLTRLPDNFGVLTYLETLILSNNRLSKLPRSFDGLSSLRTLDLSANSFAYIPEEFSSMMNLVDLDLSNNLFSTFPYPLTKLESLKILKIGKNAMSHLGIMPPLLQYKDMFVPVIDEVYGKQMYMNILTRERVLHVELFTTDRIMRTPDLHTFQREGSKGYRRRKMWLSVSGIHEWEPATDPATGQTFYRNNVSGNTSWEMPPSLDTLGKMAQLQELTIRDNAISFLPPSFANMTNLVKFNVVRNRLKELPENIGNMKQLQIFDLSSNELTLLPVSICDCTSLQLLNLDDNHLIRLPENLGFLPNLRSLSLNANRLTTIPFSLGYCKTLRTLSVTENVIVDPPMDEFAKGLDTVRWYLRNRFMIDKHGMPPPMEYHAISVAHEITILKPELDETIHQKIVGAQKDGVLNLQLLGLKNIPAEVLQMKNLKRLKMDFNDYLDISQGLPEELHRLQGLSFRACQLPVLPQNLHIFERLTVLNLEENKLEWLPESLCEVMTLTSLNLSKNHIYELPPGFHHLTALQTLILDSNYLEEVCDDFHLLKDLKVLNLAKNRLQDVPSSICHLLNLRTLSLEKNKLTIIPRLLNRLSLVDLRIGHNRIENLEDDLFAHELGEHIRLFSCAENNLLELPTSLMLLDSTCSLEADYNPLISPPPYLLSDGLKMLKNYMAIRGGRRKLLYNLMEDEDFVLSEDSFSPIACEVLEDGTGFLTPEDLAAFDQAVQEYMNGEFFKCPATGEEIVARVVALRESRETEMYLMIINAFLQTLREIMADEEGKEQLPIYSGFNESNVFVVQRPWGRRGEMCNCWAVSLQALLRETPSNLFHPQGRPSIFNLIAAKLPEMAFPFTVDLLKDSIRLYISPYGPIADTEQVTFPTCDCVDDLRGKPKRHDPCNKAAVVLAKSVYIDAEADRREVEEDEFMERFEAVEDDVRIWLVTEEGRRALEAEVRKRKNILKEEISLREEMLLSQQLKLKKKSDELKNLNSRLELFLMAAPYEQHGFYTKEEANVLIDKATEESDRFKARIEVLKTIVGDLKEKLAVDWKTSCITAASDLVQKYCVKAYDQAVYSFRRTAAEKGWKRHWDGSDGRSFEDWLRKHYFVKKKSGDDDDDNENTSKNTSANNTAANTPRGGGGLQRANSASSVHSAASNATNATGTTAGGRELAPEFSWEDTANMDKYRLGLYDMYRNTNGFSFVPR